MTECICRRATRGLRVRNALMRRPTVNAAAQVCSFFIANFFHFSLLLYALYFESAFLVSSEIPVLCRATKFPFTKEA